MRHPTSSPCDTGATGYPSLPIPIRWAALARDRRAAATPSGRSWIGRLRPYVMGASLSLIGVSDALAAEAAKGPSEVIFLAQLIVLMLIGRLLGEAMKRIGQPSVMDMLLGGIRLGPTLLGVL